MSEATDGARPRLVRKPIKDDTIAPSSDDVGELEGEDTPTVVGLDAVSDVSGELGDPGYKKSVVEISVVIGVL